MIKQVSLLLFTTFLFSLQTSTLAAEKECTAARFIALFGTNTPDSPYVNFTTPTQCCEACQEYKDNGCEAYTFFYGECKNECWLKTRVTFQYFKPNAVSGSYYISSPTGGKKPKVSVLDVPGTVDTTVGSLPPVLQSTIPGWLRKQIDKDCDLEDVYTNFKYKAGKSDPLPIFNLKCPADCKKACYNHQEMSGRYSCVAYNFVYAKDVTECWLLTGTGIRFPKPGYACGKSERSGHEMGSPPTKYQEILELYRSLLKDSTRCLGTIEDLSALGF